MTKRQIWVATVLATRLKDGVHSSSAFSEVGVKSEAETLGEAMIRAHAKYPDADGWELKSGTYRAEIEVQVLMDGRPIASPPEANTEANRIREGK